MCVAHWLEEIHEVTYMQSPLNLAGTGSYTQVDGLGQEEQQEAELRHGSDPARVLALSFRYRQSAHSNCISSLPPVLSLHDEL